MSSHSGGVRHLRLRLTFGELGEAAETQETKAQCFRLDDEVKLIYSYYMDEEKEEKVTEVMTLSVDEAGHVRAAKLRRVGRPERFYFEKDQAFDFTYETMAGEMEMTVLTDSLRGNVSESGILAEIIYRLWAGEDYLGVRRIRAEEIVSKEESFVTIL